jgi:hypothetical protein
MGDPRKRDAFMRAIRDLAYDKFVKAEAVESQGA